jgi:hypothetical protein
VKRPEHRRGPSFTLSRRPKEASMTSRKRPTPRVSPKKATPKLRLQRQTLRDLEATKGQPKGGACPQRSNDVT